MLSWWLLLTLLLIVAVNVSRRTPEFEVGVYHAYTTSILHDGDFNIVDDVHPEIAWLVSPTFNVPDMHSNGLSVVWAPFYVYYELLRAAGFSGIRTARGPEGLEIFPQALASVFLFLVSILLLRDCFRPEMSRWKAPLIGFPLVTSSLYYAFFAYGGTDPTVLFMGTFAFATAWLGFESNSRWDSFFIGLASGVFLMIKLSMIFYVPFALYLAMRSSPRIRSVLGFAVGLSLPISAMLINRYLQLGYVSLEAGNAYCFSPMNLLDPRGLWDLLLTPGGMLYISPALVAVVIAPLFLKKDLRRFAFSLFWLGFAAKLVLELTAIGNAATEFGMRHFLSDTPLFISAFYLLAGDAALERSSKRLLAVKTLYAAFLAWGIVYFFWYLDLNWFASSEVGIRYIDALDHIPRVAGALAEQFSRPLSLAPVATLLSLPLTFALALVLAKWNETRVWFSSHWRGVFVTLASVYLAMTASNLVMNQRNVATLKATGFFEKTVVAMGPSAFVYDDYMSEVVRSLERDKVSGDRLTYDKRMNGMNDFTQVVAREILHDPIGFRTDLERGKLRRNFLDDSLDPEILKDFETRQLRK
ncbi:MAG: hypothetical protein V4760_08225 [Bdellovibrionota bacterium]